MEVEMYGEPQTGRVTFEAGRNPMADAEALRAYLDGYMSTMRGAVPAMSGEHWRGYLNGLEALEGSVLGWLDRNAK